LALPEERFHKLVVARNSEKSVAWDHDDEQGAQSPVHFLPKVAVERTFENVCLVLMLAFEEDRKEARKACGC
jgi:hypothetical protein